MTKLDSFGEGGEFDPFACEPRASAAPSAPVASSDQDGDQPLVVARAHPSGDDADDEVEDPEVVEWGNRLDELDAAATAAEEAGEPRAIASAFIALAEHLAGVAEPDDLISLLITAREAYERFDPVAAADCAVDVAKCAVAIGDLDQAELALDVALGEFDDLGEEEKWLRALGVYGSVVAQLGELDLAEQALSTSLSGSDRFGFSPDEVIELRVTLANVYSAGGRTGLAEQELTSLRGQVPVDSYSEAICRESLGALYAESGRAHLARPEIERAIAVYEALDDEMRVLEAKIALSWVLMATGLGDAGAAMLESVRDRFAELERPDRVAVCDYNLAYFHVLRFRFADADAAFDSATTGLAAAGMHHQLANLQWNRVKRLTMEGAVNPARADALKRQAVDTAISAVIAADYERFQFDDPERRAQWMEKLGHRISMTFLLTYAAGSPSLLADLIESALSAGVYGLDAAGADEIAPVDGARASSTASERGDDDGEDGGFALAMGASALLSTPLLPLAPPPALVDGAGRELLGAQRALAAQLDPGLAHILATVPRVPVW